MFICRKVYIKLRYVYIITCSSAGKLIKVAACIYHHVFVRKKVDKKLWYVNIITCSSARTLIWSFRYVYIITCLSVEKFIESHGMYISLRVHLQESWYKVAVCISSRAYLHESWYKVAVCIYHHVLICEKVDMKFSVCIHYHVFICRKVHRKSWYVYLNTCSSAGKLI